MKRNFLLLMAGALATSVSARHLTPEEALARLDSPPGTVATISGLQTRGLDSYSAEPQPFTGVYIFNTNPGFIIVSADDCAVPLLGYSETGNFEYSNIPEAMLSWLKSYEREIEWGNLNNVAYTTETLNLSAAPVVKPLVETIWDQYDPYNMMCSEKVGKEVATGCVPTAIAQIMYNFKFPEKGRGTIDYQTSKSGYNARINCDFSNLNIDWDNMARSYKGSNTKEEKDAVSTLMFAVAAANQIQFGATSTGYTQYTPVGMYKYLNYTPAIQWVSRDFYTTREWEDMIYNQLTQGLAVKYGGYTPENAGHAFVCDGCDGKGYFHINWGWSGDYNGYFKLDALNPAGQGSGGAEGGYNKDQDMVINIFPAGEQYQNINDCLIYSLGNFNATNLTSATQSLKVTLGNNVTFFTSGGSGPGGSTSNASIRNQTGCDLKGNAGLLILPKNGESPIESYSSTTSTLYAGTTSGISNFSIPIPKDLSTGTYIVLPIFKVEGETEYVEIKGKPTSNNSMTLDVTTSGATLSWGGVNPETSAIEFNSKVIPGANFSMDFTLQNPTPVSYSGTIGVKFYKGQTLMAQSSDGVDVSIAPGESVSENFTGIVTEARNQTLSAGEYSVVLYDLVTDRNIANTEGTAFMVTVEEIPAGNTVFIISGLDVSQPEPSNPYYVVVSGTVKCTSGYYADCVTVQVVQTFATSNEVSAQSEYMFLESGESAEFSVPFQLTNSLSSGSTQYRYTITATSGGKSSTKTYNLDPTVYTLDITGSEYTVDEKKAQVALTLIYEVSESFLDHNIEVTVNGEAYEGETFLIEATSGSLTLTLPLEDGLNSFEIILSVNNVSVTEIFEINYDSTIVTTISQQEDGIIEIYDLSGKRLCSVPADKVIERLPRGGIYVIKQGNSIKKTILI